MQSRWTRTASLLLIVGSAVAMLPLALSAQSATEEPVNETLPDGVEVVIAELSPLAPFEYPIELIGGETLTLIAHDPSGAADPVMRVLDDEGNALLENDNHTSELVGLTDTDAALESFTLAAGGTYTIEISNNFYSDGTVDLYIITNEDVIVQELFEALPEVTPQADLQSTRRTTGPCTVSVDFISARLRTAPTTNSSQAGAVQPGESFAVNAQVNGADGFTWYRLTNYLWVRADAVISAGACRSVPTL
jgi:hypothetical protein